MDAIIGYKLATSLDCRGIVTIHGQNILILKKVLRGTVKIHHVESDHS
jgi:hypothetical protein